MLLQDLLFEMPKLINATEFNLDRPAVNRRLAYDMKMNGEKLEDIVGVGVLYKNGSKIALVVQDEGVPTHLIYFVQWKEVFHNFVGHIASSQIAVWADSVDPRSTGIAKKIFWEQLLPIHGVLITDALQTPDGQRFWRNRLSEAFENKLNVYFLNLIPAKNLHTRELIKIADLKDFTKLAATKEFWGKEELHRARKIIISSVEIE